MLDLTDLAALALMAGLLAVAIYCKRSLVRESRGLEAHAHADGTVHEHHRGGSPHIHPTVVERYDRRVSRLFGESSRAES